jgi:AcrR family transcriptional regulator
MTDRPLLPGNARRVEARGRSLTPKSIATERRILEAATSIFEQKGYMSTSLQDIADAAGILKGSIYYYIDSKEDLLYAVIQNLHDDAARNLYRLPEEAGSRAQLHRFVYDHLLNFGRDLSSIRVFYTEYRMVTGERHERIMQARADYEGFTTQLIQDAIDDGWACPTLRPNIAATAILTMINSIYLWYNPRGDVPIEVIATTLTQQALQGLTCPPDHDHTKPPRRPRRTGSGAPARARAKAPAKPTRTPRRTADGG